MDYIIGNGGGILGNHKSGFTPEGGMAIWVSNGTASTLKGGSLVAWDDTTSLVVVPHLYTAPGANQSSSFAGVAWTDIAGNSEGWIVVLGRVAILAEDSQAITRGLCIDRTSTQAGRALDTSRSTLGARDEGVGIWLESKAGGTDQTVTAFLCGGGYL